MLREKRVSGASLGGERLSGVSGQGFRQGGRAGEASGKVNEVFRNLADSLKWQDELAAQAKKIVTYPAIVFVVVTAVTFFLMIYLVPQLTSFIRNMGQEIPLHTRALMVVSDFFVNYWWAVLAAPFAACSPASAKKTNAVTM